jgi:hypothetical protein
MINQRKLDNQQKILAGLDLKAPGHSFVVNNVPLVLDIRLHLVGLSGTTLHRLPVRIEQMHHLCSLSLGEPVLQFFLRTPTADGCSS